MPIVFNKTSCVVAFSLCLMTLPAYAYIDPSAGSLWVQSLIAMFAGIGALLRVYWQTIKKWWVKDATQDPNDNH